MALLDSTTTDLLPLPETESEIASVLRRCIHIGLLCVQESPDDRPAMSTVVAMLTTKTSQIEQPNRPGIYNRPVARDLSLVRPLTINVTQPA